MQITDTNFCLGVISGSSPDSSGVTTMTKFSEREASKHLASNVHTCTCKITHVHNQVCYIIQLL